MPNSKFAQIILRPGREQSLLRKHPWVFSGAIDTVEGNPQTGESVLLRSAKGAVLGWGAYSPASQIRVRMWSFQEDQIPNDEMLHSRIASAVEMRKRLPDARQTDALRLIHSESDQLPGIIADSFGEVVVLHLHTAGAYHWRDVIHSAIRDVTHCRTLLEVSEDEVLKLEGLTPFHDQEGDAVSNPFLISEHGLKYQIDLSEGQKTGFYLDQRQNRLAIRKYSSGGKVLDAFSYSGGFSMNALMGMASSIDAIDSSAAALQLLKSNLDLNGFGEKKQSQIQANVFEHLRKLRDQNARYNLIVLDPPKLAPTRAQAEKAARAYKDLQILALKLLDSRGILMTFSCSGGVDMSLFKKILMDASLDANRQVQIIEQLHQAADHPVQPCFPEGEYLKGLVCVVD